ncbi:MAG: Radical domain protein [Actinomycetia bacterium]|nr:Radical domain protein [Actinomycetes bacterium]
MELAEIIGLRPQPAAGLLMALTRRCPMRCAHCSTDSSMTGRDPDQEPFLRFVRSFTRRDRPDALLLTGGEPLLLPGLVTQIVAAAHDAGTRCAVLTGAFFARSARIPAAILSVVDVVDHFSVSTDAFHEREISRTDVFRLLRQVLDAGTPVSIHTVGAGDDDPYLADLIRDVTRAFGSMVPILVNAIRPVGRASGLPGLSAAGGGSPDPRRALSCAMAAWPVVAPDGEIVACCNQSVVDRRPVPRHLSLGHVTTDDWAVVRNRVLASPILRAIRTVGPSHILARAGAPEGGYCAGCRGLGEDPAAAAEAVRIGAGVAGRLLADHAAHIQVAAGPVAFVRRHGCARYADLVTMGSKAGRS